MPHIEQDNFPLDALLIVYRLGSGARCESQHPAGSQTFRPRAGNTHSAVQQDGLHPAFRRQIELMALWFACAFSGDSSLDHIGRSNVADRVGLEKEVVDGQTSFA